MLGDCVICCQSLNDGIGSLQCGHVYHFDCVKPWILQSKTCPICRTKQKLKDLIKLVIDDDGIDWSQKLEEVHDDLKQVKRELRRTRRELSTVNENLEESEKRCEILEKSNNSLAKKLRDANFQLRRAEDDFSSQFVPILEVDPLFHNYQPPPINGKRKVVDNFLEFRSPKPKRRHFEKERFFTR